MSINTTLKTTLSLLLFLAIPAKFFAQIIPGPIGPVNVSVTITTINSGYDCGGDQGGLPGINNPDPRYLFNVGYNGGNYAGNTLIGGDDVSCPNWNINDQTIRTLTNVNATQINIASTYWEEDCGGGNSYDNCCNPILGICTGEDDGYSTGTFNINFLNDPQGQVNSYTYNFGNGGYSVNIFWTQACPVPVPTSITPDATICSGQSITLSLGGALGTGQSFVWYAGGCGNGAPVGTGPNLTVSPNATTTYFGRIEMGCNVSGCRYTTVTVNQTPTAGITGNNVICAGQNTVFTGSGVGNYFWSTGATSNAITVSNAGVYRLTVTSNQGCSSTASRTLTVNANPTPGITGNLSICQGTSTTLTANGGTSYLWSTGATTAAITTNAAGLYSVTATNAQGCTGSTSAIVVVNPLPTPSISGTTTICADQFTTFTASGGNTYTWSNGATTASITANVSGTYTVTATSGAGCTASVSTTLTVNALPTPVIAGPTAGCSDQTVTLNVSGGDGFVWSTGSTNTSITVSPGQTYTVTATAINTCTASASQNVAALPIPNTAINGIPLLCPNQTTVLTATGGDSYVWGNGSSSNAITISNPGTYDVTASLANGCTASATWTVTPDNVAPVWNCPGTQTVSAPLIVTLPDFLATVPVADNCGIASVTQSPAAGIQYYATTQVPITLTATDVNGNVSVCNFTADMQVLPCGGNNVIFVNDNANGLNNGTNWLNAYTNLQTALAAAQPGNEIWVREGTYKPTATLDRNIAFNLRAGVSLYGGFPDASFVCDLQGRNPILYQTNLSGDIGVVGTNADNSFRVVNANNVGDAVIVDGFIIREAYATGNGGGLGVTGSGVGKISNPIFRSCVFAGNAADGKGGGCFIYALSSGVANPQFQQCSFVFNNAANDGGGLCAMAQTSGVSNYTVTNCVFENNSTPKKGAAICHWSNAGGTIISNLAGCSIINNNCTTNGGGIWSYARQGATFTLNAVDCEISNNIAQNGPAAYNYSAGGNVTSYFTNCTINNNTASKYGAVTSYSESAGLSNTIIDACTFEGNVSSEAAAYGHIALGASFNLGTIRNSMFKTNDGRGGAVEVYATGLNTVANLTLDNNVFWQNSSPGAGGAININVTTNANQTCTVNHCTFNGNTAVSYGAAEYHNVTGVSTSSTFTNNNCIFWNNIAGYPTGRTFHQNSTNSSINLNNCLVNNPLCAANGAGVGPLVCTGALIAADPYFINAGATDLHLLAGSPAIDVVQSGLTSDYDGNARPQGAGYDLGAFEYLAIAPRLATQEYAQTDVNVYPNPTTGTVTLDFSKSVNGWARLVNLQGGLVSETQLNGEKQMSMDLSSLPSGYYFIQIMTSEATIVKKVLKE